MFVLMLIATTILLTNSIFLIRKQQKEKNKKVDIALETANILQELQSFGFSLVKIDAQDVFIRRR